MLLQIIFISVQLLSVLAWCTVQESINWKNPSILFEVGLFIMSALMTLISFPPIKINVNLALSAVMNLAYDTFEFSVNIFKGK